MPKTREKRQSKNRQAILDAALRIITEKGPAELSMRLLADRIDYSPAALYEYFDSKEAILQAVVQEGHWQLTRALQAVDAELPPVAYLREIGLAYIRFAVGHPETYLLMFSNTPPQDTLQDMLEDGSSYPILLHAIQRGTEAGDFYPREGFGLQAMAYAAWAQVHGIAMLRITYLRDFPIPFETVDPQALAALVQGFQRA